MFETESIWRLLLSAGEHASSGDRFRRPRSLRSSGHFAMTRRPTSSSPSSTRLFVLIDVVNAVKSRAKILATAARTVKLGVVDAVVCRPQTRWQYHLNGFNAGECSSGWCVRSDARRHQIRWAVPDILRRRDMATRAKDARSARSSTEHRGHRSHHHITSRRARL